MIVCGRRDVECIGLINARRISEDLLRKTPNFYQGAQHRLEVDLGGAYRFAGAHFGGNNLYMDAVKQNIRFAERVSVEPVIALKRKAPETNGGK